MKIIRKCTLALETTKEVVHSTGYYSPESIVNAQRICKELNKDLGDGPDHYVVVRDDYRLWSGMEDLV